MAIDKGKKPEVVPNTDDEDIDDLDDVLDQFNNAPPPKVSVAINPPLQPKIDPPTNAPPLRGDDTVDEEAFAAELAANMEMLMRELGNAPDGSGDPDTSDAAMKAAWEKMLVGDLDGPNGGDVDTLFGPTPPSLPTRGPPTGSSGGAGATPGSGSSQEDPFQRAIRQGMEKLKESDSTLNAEAKDSDPLAKLMKDFNLADLGLDDDGDEGGEQLQGMLEGMMSQLMSKEILHEPLSELKVKFPNYLKENDAKLSADEKTRYNEQLDRITQIVAIFDKPGYKDEDTEQSMEVLRLMNEMQSFGSPPAELMGEMPPGMSLGPDGLPSLPEGCVIA